jgi:hypothetical protein
MQATCTSASAFASAGSPIGNELSNYLDNDSLTQFDDGFNIISWWHEHKLSYPILSILARDVLTVPVSTVSSVLLAGSLRSGGDD